MKVTDSRDSLARAMCVHVGIMVSYGFVQFGVIMAAYLTIGPDPACVPV